MALLCVCAGVLSAQPQMKIFQLNNRPAAATVEIVRQVLTPSGTVFPEERLNKLIVKDSPEALERVGKLLEEIDQPAPQVRIHVNSTAAAESSGLQAGVAVGARGRVIGVAGNAQAANDSQNVRSDQNLLIMSGETGRIMVARDIVAVQPYLNFVQGLGLVPPGVIFQQVSTGFSVSPTVVGDVVRMRITPWMSYAGPRGLGQIEILESSTTVSVKSGDSVQIASSMGRNTREGNAFGLILGGNAQSAANAGQITLRAEVVPDWSKP